VTAAKTKSTPAAKKPANTRSKATKVEEPVKENEAADSDEV